MYFCVDEFFEMIIGEVVKKFRFVIVMRYIFEGFDFVVFVKEKVNVVFVDLNKNFVVESVLVV